jgi:hypothetical protein
MKLGIASVGVNIRQIQPCTSQLVQTGVAVEKLDIYENGMILGGS